ncbi:MAG: AMP-binding protein, partial [Steroidobacterales bacterium]
MREGDTLWIPGAERIERANVTAFGRWLQRERGLSFGSYKELWRWSVQDLEAFWGALWEYFGVEASSPYTRVLGRRAMPGAEWFPGARLNYSQNVLRRERDGGIALLHASETRPLEKMTWAELGGQVRILATQLRAFGVQPGDRVVAWMPNIPQTVVAMLAATAIGAIWACCSPDFGERGVLDRFAQLSPQVLFCIDGYRYGGRAFDRRAELARILAGLPTLRQVIYLPYLDPQGPPPRPDALRWSQVLDHPPIAADRFRFEQVPFEQPLWTLFSSGTTGLPKAIVHGHGGILLETQKNAGFHFDLHPGERLLFFTTTGWMLWNFLA